MATILKRKATPRKRPARNNLKFEIWNFKFETRSAATRIGKIIKFSAFAIFPSSIGKPKRTAKIKVVRYWMLFLSLKSFLDNKKKNKTASMPKIREASLIVNWSEWKKEYSQYKRGGLLSNISLYNSFPLFKDVPITWYIPSSPYQSGSKREGSLNIKNRKEANIKNRNSPLPFIFRLTQYDPELAERIIAFP